MHSTEQFVFPVNLSIEPIKRLLVASYDGDPEYEMIEPQLFDDTIYGKGLRILMYRKDKRVDVYWQPGVFFESSTFNIGGGPGKFAETSMFPARFDISESGIDIDIAFTDIDGRGVELKIKENTSNHNRFPFLAPVGKDVQKPDKLFLAFMQEFDFVKREGSVFHTKIGDRVLKPALFPIKRDKKKVYFARYASKLTIGEINAPIYKPLVANLSQGLNKTGSSNIWLNENNKITKCWVQYDTDSVELEFEPGFPNLISLPQNKEVRGDWSYKVSDTKITGGNYVLLRNENRVTAKMNVTQNWKPQNLPFSFTIFTRVMRSFRTWPTTYSWQAAVDLENMRLQGQWQRKQ